MPKTGHQLPRPQSPIAGDPAELEKSLVQLADEAQQRLYINGMRVRHTWREKGDRDA